MQNSSTQPLTGEHKPDPDRKQRRASDPAASVWVGASAGTGKTKILTDRVLRLMLPRPDLGPDSGTPPGRILCITFTKAAAAEMANRINEKLGEWAVMSEDDLRADLAKLNGEPPNDDMMREARRLFARVVDVPGGMKIMTIHAFCQSVLRRFPLESGLSPHFEVMDERTAREYLRDAQHHVIAHARANPDSDIAHALDHVTSLLDTESMARLMGNLAQERSRLVRILESHQGYGPTVDAVYRKVHLKPGETRADILNSFCADAACDLPALRAACKALDSGSSTDKDRAALMAPFLEAAPEDRPAIFNAYAKAYLTGKFEIRKRLATKQAQEKRPGIVDTLEAEAERVLAAHNRMQAVKVAEGTRALLLIGDEILKLYRARKESLAQLDYDDLIYTTRDLLARDDSAAWVLFKLDDGIDHILVDEAQDTNPEQWQVIRALAVEFFAGLGTRDETVLRTIFAVGDEKQSIFSFQRADPAEFNRMREYFKERVEAAGQEWRPEDLDISFRSTRTVLELVDKVFEKGGEARDGVVFNPETEIEHKPFRVGHAGLVEMWPLVRAEEPDPPEAWAPPEATEGIEDAPTRLAAKIADTIKHWIDTGEKLDSLDRPVRPGDILVLVRSRKPFVEPFVRALKTRQIPVSGVDRMVLTEQLGVMDLLAFANFALLPEDDLTLATVLKTPLIGLDDDDLFRLAHGRSGSLWQEVRKRDDEVATYLKRLVARVGYVPPYAFFAELLGKPCPADEVSGWRAMLARLGFDTEEALEELLNAALEFEALHPPAMQEFIDWFGKGQAEIKREQEQGGGNMVRIMTVHGSKGLQAPVVFLPDMTGHPRRNNAARPRLLWPDNENGVPLWAPSQAFEDQVFERLRHIEEEKRDQEYRRLLYVALTRARDRLYICGFRGKQRPAEDTWYELVRRRFTPIAEQIDFDIDGDPVLDEDGGFPLPALRLTHPQTKEPERGDEEAARIHTDPVPAWATRSPPGEPTPPRPLMPSRPSEDEPAVSSPLDEDDSWRFKRGNLVHRLLETLPEIAPDRRRAAAETFLKNPAHDLPADKQAALADEVMAVLDHAGFAPIFAAGSRAEVPVTGLVERGDGGDPQVISGQIDRMAVLDDRILIVDYKTNRPPPLHPEEVAEIYLKQMAAYRAAVRAIYPGREVQCALLWTDGPRLMPLPSGLLDTHSP